MSWFGWGKSSDDTSSHSPVETPSTPMDLSGGVSFDITDRATNHVGFLFYYLTGCFNLLFVI